MDFKNLNKCWLSPLGEIIIKSHEFAGEGAWHENLALCILRDYWKLKNKKEAFKKVHKVIGNTATDELENMGWIRLHSIHGLNTKPKWILPINREVTKKQESIILDWCLTNNISYNNCFKF